MSALVEIINVIKMLSVKILTEVTAVLAIMVLLVRYIFVPSHGEITLFDKETVECAVM